MKVEAPGSTTAVGTPPDACGQRKSNTLFIKGMLPNQGVAHTHMYVYDCVYISIYLSYLSIYLYVYIYICVCVYVYWLYCIHCTVCIYFWPGSLTASTYSPPCLVAVPSAQPWLSTTLLGATPSPSSPVTSLNASDIWSIWLIYNIAYIYICTVYDLYLMYAISGISSYMIYRAHQS